MTAPTAESDAALVTPLSRRGLILGALSLLAAPAIVRAASLMKCSGVIIPTAEDVARILDPAWQPAALMNFRVTIKDTNGNTLVQIVDGSGAVVRHNWKTLEAST